MTRKKKIVAIGAMFLLMIALCIPVFSGALAESAQQIDIPIGQETEVLDAVGAQLGFLVPDQASGILFRSVSGETIPGVRVRYEVTAQVESLQGPLTGKTVVSLSLSQADEATGTPTPSDSTEATPAPQTTVEAAGAELPQYGWIDSDLVITALSARHMLDLSQIDAQDNEIAALKESEANTKQESNGTASLPAGQDDGTINQRNSFSWVPLAALALGIICAGALGWIAISVSSVRHEEEIQTEQLMKFNERVREGVTIKSPIKVESTAWPHEARVQIVSDALDHVAKNANQSGANGSQNHSEPVQPPKPKPIPEGEEPDLLALVNRLAGVPSSAKWRDMVREAGWRTVLLQANPTEKGTYIADDSGYSIIAALMRSAEAEIAYIVPSYQDPNASENRWSEFYIVNEDIGVKNYRVDALPVMFIERGTFFLLKSKGRLTRRPQY